MHDQDELEARVYLIGYICLQWSYLEYLLAIAIWHALKLTPETGQIVTGGLDIKPRSLMAYRLAQKVKMPKALTGKLGRASEAVTLIQGDRNLAVHGIYGLHASGKVTAEVHRGKYRGSAQEMSADRLFQTCNEIDKVINDLEPTMAEFGLIDVSRPVPPLPSP